MENNKTKRRFNVIDALIILVVIALLVGVAYRYNVAGKISQKTNSQNVVISVQVSGIRQSQVDAIQVGDKVYLDNNSMLIGTIISKGTPTQAVRYEADENGIVKMTYNDEKYDLRYEIEAVGNMTSDGFMLNGTQYLAANLSTEVKSTHTDNTITIMSIREAE